MLLAGYAPKDSTRPFKTPSSDCKGSHPAHLVLGAFCTTAANATAIEVWAR